MYGAVVVALLLVGITAVVPATHLHGQMLAGITATRSNETPSAQVLAGAESPAGSGLNVSAAVFSQAADPASGIYFTYRVGMSVVAGFGTSSVYYMLSNTTALGLEFPGSTPIVPRGVNPLASKTSYFYGSDPSAWRTGLIDFGAVEYEAIYPGIDLQYKTEGGSLKYEFIVHPGANPSAITLNYTNADVIEVGSGEVRAIASGEKLRDTGLFVYQKSLEGRDNIACSFRGVGDNLVGFEVGAYDPSSDLIIDPLNILSFSTLIGGIGVDAANELDLDKSGAVYITGFTWSAGFPTTPGAYDRTFEGTNTCAFVTKFSPDGSTLLYSTFLGGSSGDAEGKSIAVENGMAHVTGYTTSNAFPTTVGAFNRNYGGSTDVFVTKLSADGSALLYSTYLGGVSVDSAYGIDVDNGTAYITGGTASVAFPTTSGAYDQTYNASYDAFVTRISEDGSALLYSTYIGGTIDEYGYGIAAENGLAYITGYTTSTNFPTTPGAYDRIHNGSQEVFVSKFSANGSKLVYSTFLGGSLGDYGWSIDVENELAYVTGITASTTFVTTPGAFDTTHNGGDDVFVAKLSASGSTLLFSTFLGGSNAEREPDIDVESGVVFLTGSTLSPVFPVTAGAYDSSHNGGNDVFLSKLSADGSSLLYGTFIGAGSSDYGNGIAVKNGAAYIAGSTSSSTFPTTGGAYDTSLSGGSDAFVLKLTKDADVDGMPDDWEIAHGLNPNANDAGGDLDADGIANAQEYALGTRPDAADTDCDGRPDGAETTMGLNPLVPDVDHYLEFGTYIGGSGTDRGVATAAENGRIYITGYTNSNPFPTTPGANSSTFRGINDVFLAALEPDGSSLLYSTYIGGTGDDAGMSLAVESGAAYITGYTSSTNFPTTPGAKNVTYNGGSYDLFVTKVSADGSKLLYSTYLGGSLFDAGGDIAVENGVAYVIGTTYSTTFPTTANGYDRIANGQSDVFMAKISANGSQLLYSTYIGGASVDAGSAIAVDQGVAFITGRTDSIAFPTTPNAHDRTHNGFLDVFVAKIRTDGYGLVYSTFVGGAGDENAYDIAIEDGFAYVSGTTTSTTFPVTANAFDVSSNGNLDAFVFKLEADGSRLLYGTYLGGVLDDAAGGLDVEDGVVYVTGSTSSSGFPTTPDALAPSFLGGTFDAFLAELSAGGSTLVYSTFIGGAGTDGGNDIALANHAVYIIGVTNSTRFPTTEGAYDTTANGAEDVFVAKIVRDVDADGMPDDWETTHGLNPLVDDAGADKDADGLSNLVEYELGTLPENMDTDSDGRLDGVEVTMGTDPLVPDVQHRLEFGTYLGGSGTDVGKSIAVENGISYVTGYTDSAAFPRTPGANGTTFMGGPTDAFVSKLSADGRTLLYSTYIGGNGGDYGYSIVVEAGIAYITGQTNSNNFPTTQGANQSANAGVYDVFVTKVSVDGTKLLYSTLLGGTSNDLGFALAVENGEVYVTGYTSLNFPTTPGAYDIVSNGNLDAFATKISGDGRTLLYSTYIGGTYDDQGIAIAVKNGAVYITGIAGDGFPTTAGAFDKSYNGMEDMFVLKLRPDGAALSYSTYIGGTDNDVGIGIAVEDGFAFVTGNTLSTGFPITAGALDMSLGGFQDAVVVKLSRDGSRLVYSTFLGGEDSDYACGIDVEDDITCVVGSTFSTSFPTTADAFSQSHSGGFLDMFLTEISTSGAGLVYSTYFGGNATDTGAGVAVEDSAAYILGNSWSPNFPATSGAFDTALNGMGDLVILKMIRDLDGDGMPDDWENAHGLDRLRDDAGEDPDADGLSNLQEYSIGTDPHASDTDADGRPDGLELTLGKDPLVPDVAHRLEFGTYLGGVGLESGSGIAVEGGAVYVTGYTESADFPVTPFAVGKIALGQFDAFVAEISTDGGTLIYSTYIGGTGNDWGKAIAVENGIATFTGYTMSGNFPWTAGANDTLFSGAVDGFVTKLGVGGTSIVYSTFLGGPGSDYASSIAVENGEAYVTGYTTATGFPTTPGAYDLSYNGAEDAFVTKFSSTGDKLLYSTYLGGTGNDRGQGIAVEGGAAYVTGYTRSNPFSSVSNGYDQSYNGLDDAFVVKLSPSGNNLLYSTYLGGSSDDQGSGIDVESGIACIVGYTFSTNFPTTPNSYAPTYKGGVTDAFVAKISVDGGALLYSTFFGGVGAEYGRGISFERDVATIVGFTSSVNLPATIGSYDTLLDGAGDAFVAQLSTTSGSLIFSTYLGGENTDDGFGIAVESGSAYIVGETSSSAFPATAGAYDGSYNGNADIFIAKLATDVDGDGMTDGWEVAYGLNPQGNDAGGDLDADGLTNIDEFAHATRPNALDTDGDGMPDGWEVDHSLNPRSNDASGDPDADGLTNLQEWQHGTNPFVSDTDGDGVSDGAEVAAGTDPLHKPTTDNNQWIVWVALGVAGAAIVIALLLSGRTKAQMQSQSREIERLSKELAARKDEIPGKAKGTTYIDVPSTPKDEIPAKAKEASSAIAPPERKDDAIVKAKDAGGLKAPAGQKGNAPKNMKDQKPAKK